VTFEFHDVGNYYSARNIKCSFCKIQFHKIKINYYMPITRSWDSTTSIVTGYGLNDQGVAVRVGVRFFSSTLSRPVLGPA
jgi:hypothetical protein